MVKKKEKNIGWPVGGLHENFAFANQPDRTTADVQNVRAYDPNSGRSRGGQRPGLVRHINSLVNSTNTIQNINHFVTSNAYSGATTLSTRTIKGIVVAGGTIKTFTTSYATPTNGGSALSATAPVIYSTRFFDDIYFADGTNIKYYDSSADEVKAWAASAGTFPISGSDYPRLIATYNNRIVLSGLDGDPQNFFATAVGTPGDFNYSPATITSTIAFAGNTGQAATIPDKIHCLIDTPAGDTLIFGCDHSIFQMSGDIAAGGRIDLVSGTVGMAWGRPFAVNPDGITYFFGSRGGVYAMASGMAPRRLTGDRIDERLATISMASSLITMAWDDRQQGVYLFITPLGGGATTNYFYDQRNDSWWKDVHATNAMNPVGVHLYDGDTESDRRILLGGQDGYMRSISMSATNDDTATISSYVYLGPITLSQTVCVEELYAVLASGSSDVAFELYAGPDAENAFNSTAVVYNGTWSAGSNRPRRPKTRDKYIWIKVLNSTASQTWAMESISVIVSEGSRLMRRVFSQ